MSDRLKAHVLINLSCLFWAGNMTVGRAARHVMGPWALVGARAVLSSILLLILLRFLRSRWEPRLSTDWKRLLFMSFSGVAAYQAALYVALRFTDSVNVALISATTPLVTIFLARLVASGLVVGAQVFGGLLSLFGVIVILSRGSWAYLLRFDFNFGDMLILVSVLLWSGYAIAGQKVMRERSMLSVTTIITLMSVPMLLPVAGWELSRQPLEFTPQVAGVVGYVTLFAGVAAMLCWNHGVKILGPAEAMAFMNMTPIYTAVAAAVFLSEPPSLPQLIGGIVVVAGCLLAVLLPARGRL